MKNPFTQIVILGIAVLFIFYGVTSAAAFDDMRQSPPPQERQQALSDKQKAEVKSILSKYDPSTLTAADAKAIFEAFRKAGLRGGPGMLEAIREAGFDPEKLRSLAPPPEPPGDGRRPPERP